MTLLLSPWFWLAMLLSASSLLGIGYYQGHRNGKNGCLAEQAYAIEAAVKDARLEDSRQRLAERETTRKYEQKRETVRTVYVKVKEKANENIDKNQGYGDCRLDDDGLRLYNARPVASVPTTPATGLADLPLSGSSGRGGRSAGDPLAQ